MNKRTSKSKFTSNKAAEPEDFFVHFTKQILRRRNRMDEAQKEAEERSNAARGLGSLCSVSKDKHHDVDRNAQISLGTRFLLRVL